MAERILRYVFISFADIVGYLEFLISALQISGLAASVSSNLNQLPEQVILFSAIFPGGAHYDE